MSYKAIVSDWNGTLFEYPTDEVQNKSIAYTLKDMWMWHVGREEIPKPWRIPALLKLKKAGELISRRLEGYKADKNHLWEVYEPFNKHVLRGRPVSFINSVIDEYARESASKVDARMLRPLRNVHYNGKATGILSVSYDYSIRRILQEADFADVFDVIVANTLETNSDEAVGLTLEIYERKPEVLRREFFDKRGFRENDTLYIGDSEDDEPIAELLPPGNFIVPFLASEKFKEKMTSKYEAFAPENEADLEKYLGTR